MKWPDTLQERKVKEFSFFPSAYTPFAEERELMLPEVEMDFGDGDEKEADPNDRTPSWIKNLSFTVGGVTVGAAAVYGLWATTPPPPQCLATTPPLVQTTNTTPSQAPVVTPTSSAGTLPAGAPRSTTTPATSSAPSSAGSSAQ